jgi:hypothetical protein
MTKWTTESEWRRHPAYEQGLDEALRIVAAYNLATLTLENVGQREHAAGCIEKEIRQLLMDYDRRTGRGVRRD